MNFSKFLLNILIYDISCKTLIDPKPLCIRFDKISGFVRIYDRTRYLILFGSEKFDAIYLMISYKPKKQYHIFFSHCYAKIKVDSYDFLPIEKTLTLHVIILIKSVLNEDKNHYYYMFLEKCSDQLAAK